MIRLNNIKTNIFRWLVMENVCRRELLGFLEQTSSLKFLQKFCLPTKHTRSSSLKFIEEKILTQDRNRWKHLHTWSALTNCLQWLDNNSVLYFSVKWKSTTIYTSKHSFGIKWLVTLESTISETQKNEKVHFLNSSASPESPENTLIHERTRNWRIILFPKKK